MTTKLSTILSSIQDLENDEGDIKKDFFGIFFGGIGVGKTTLVAGLAQRLKGDGKILYLDSANGWVTLSGDQKRGFRKGMDRYRIKEPSDLAVIANALAERKKGFRDYTVLIVDELSSIASRILSMALADRLGIGEEDIPSEAPEQRDYLNAQTAVTVLVKKLVELEGLHVILTAHDKDKTDRASGAIISTGADFQPGIMKSLAKDLHIVGQVTAKVGRKAGSPEPKYTREVQVLPTSRVSAKTRVPGFALKNSFSDTIRLISDWIENGEEAGDEVQGVAEDPEEGNAEVEMNDDAPIEVED